jgi:hypothetical protein
MQVAVEANAQGATLFNPRTKLSIWTFSTELDGDKDYREVVPVGTVSDLLAGGLADKLRAIRAKPNGQTGLYDTTLAAYKHAQDTFVRGKFNAVVLLTDGADQDTGGISRSALVKELRGLVDPDRPVPLIAIAVGPDADQAACREIARATGGSAQRVNDPAQINTAMLKAIVAAGEAGAPDFRP